MKAEFVFRSPGAADSVREGVRLFFSGSGYRESTGAESGLVFHRGSRAQRFLSLRVEDWPTALRIVVFSVSPGRVGVLLRYEVQTGLHLVGALDHSVLEAEAALLETYLVTGQRRALSAVVAPLRRPVLSATVLNMVIAVAVITWIGVMGDFPLHWMAVAAVLIAFLDGIVIMAFADLLVEGARKTPRLQGVNSPAETGPGEDGESATSRPGPTSGA